MGSSGFGSVVREGVESMVRWGGGAGSYGDGAGNKDDVYGW